MLDILVMKLQISERNMVAETAIEMDKNGEISKKEVSLMVQKEINDRMIEKYYYSKREEEREEKREIARQEGRLRVNSNLIGMMNRKGGKHLKNELKRLNKKESSIIFQLRSERIELNLYNSVWDKGPLFYDVIKKRGVTVEFQ